MVDKPFLNKDNRKQQAEPQKEPLQPGQKAADFTLKSTPDQQVSLNEFRGRRVVLAFYPGDWSPVCTDQLSLYNELLPEFDKYNAEIIGISVDSAWSHQAFSQNRHLHFPLLSDFEPKGAVGRNYGVYNEAAGNEKRALFVIDEEGIIRWSYVSPTGVNPGAEGILNALEALQNNQQGAKDRQENYDQTHQTGQ